MASETLSGRRLAAFLAECAEDYRMARAYGDGSILYFAFGQDESDFLPLSKWVELDTEGLKQWRERIRDSEFFTAFNKGAAFVVAVEARSV